MRICREEAIGNSLEENRELEPGNLLAGGILANTKS